MQDGTARQGHVTTDIPARLDRLPWSRWHWMIIAALGITWILDGLEVTVVGSIASVLEKKETLGLSATGVSSAASAYLVGAVVGALFFGYLTDTIGRKKLFMITLGVYTVFTVLTAFSWGLWPYIVFRFCTGLGIGGEYAAINSAIDELIPARRRGQVDLSINSTWWIGTMLASVITLGFLNLLPAQWGWRCVFGLGAVLALAVLLIRRYVPESPRWLLTHGRAEEAEQTVQQIEAEIRREQHTDNLPDPGDRRLTIDQLRGTTFMDVPRVLFSQHIGRTALALILMVTQAFLYNAIFFTQALVLTKFFNVDANATPLYVIPLAIGNLIGPWLLGRFFDTVGRKTMIAGTYIVSGLLLVGVGIMFVNGYLNATTVTLCWMLIFFFASAGASSAYLTAGELFPMETRAMAIAFIYAIGTLVGGAAAPIIFGALIQSGHAQNVFYGYMVGAVLMIVGGLAEIGLGVAAEGRSLEDVAAPLTLVGGHGVPTPHAHRRPAIG